MAGDDKTNFSHKLLLTNRQVTILCKAFANNYQLISKTRFIRWPNQDDF